MGGGTTARRVGRCTPGAPGTPLSSLGWGSAPSLRSPGLFLASPPSGPRTTQTGQAVTVGATTTVSQRVGKGPPRPWQSEGAKTAQSSAHGSPFEAPPRQGPGACPPTPTPHWAEGHVQLAQAGWQDTRPPLRDPPHQVPFPSLLSCPGPALPMGEEVPHGRAPIVPRTPPRRGP